MGRIVEESHDRNKRNQVNASVGILDGEWWMVDVKKGGIAGGQHPAENSDGSQRGVVRPA